MQKSKKKRNIDAIDTVFAILSYACVVLAIILLIYAVFAKKPTEPIVEAERPMIDNAALAISEVEDCKETEKIENAVVESIGTESEEEVVGYSIEDVARTIYAEAGTDEELGRAILTCIYNSQKKSGWTLSPTEVIEKKQYATSDTYTDGVMETCIDVLICGNLYEPILESGAEYFHSLGRGNATDFHDNPYYCEWVMYLNGEDFYRSIA